MAALDPSRGEQVSEDIGSFALESKHKIFLSHSGAQKSFVEQLAADLERQHCSPFFDERSDCLPVSRNFPSLIFKAAKQCHVAVIVLSEDYFSSKWKMIELAEFYKAQQGGNPQLKILPLFFKLSLKDLDEPTIEHRWMPKWREHASTPTSGIDLNKWSAAVKSLPRANALDFNSIAKSEASYRSVVAEAILKLSPPDLPYGISTSVIGSGQLCEILLSHFAEDKKTGTQRLGLYGMGGIGKTTLCRALCQKDFLGRVYHVELGEPSDAVLQQKQVLGELCSIRDDELDQINDTHMAIDDTKLDATAQVLDDEAHPSESYVMDSYAPGLKNLNLPESRCRVHSDDDDGGCGSISRLLVLSLGNLEPQLPKLIDRCSSLPGRPVTLTELVGYLSYPRPEVCRKALNWKAEEIRAVLKLTAEASTMDVGPDPWEYVSGSLLKQYNFDRDSSSCERSWDTLLQRYRAIRDHESKVHIAKLSCVSYWEMDEEQRSCKNLPQAFDLEWCILIDSILAAKRSFEEGKSFPDSAIPFCEFQSSESDTSHFGSADCDEEIYRDPFDSQSEEFDTQSEDHGLSGDSIATLESQTDATAESHVNQAGQNKQPSVKTSSNYSGRTRSIATSDEDLQEELISRVAPFVNKQIKDALEPLIAILQGRKEDEQKHHEKLLAIEEKKLALKWEEMQRLTLLGVSSNSCNSEMQFGRNLMLVDSPGNGVDPHGAQEGVALNVDASSHPKGMLNASGDVCNIYGGQTEHGDHSRLQTSLRSSANFGSPIRSLESAFSLDMSKRPLSFQSNACSQGFMTGTEENGVGSSDPASTLHQRLQGENIYYKYRSRSSLIAPMPETANLGMMQTDLFDEDYPTAYHLQCHGKHNPVPSSQCGASFLATPAQRTYYSGPTLLPTPPLGPAAQWHVGYPLHPQMTTSELPGTQSRGPCASSAGQQQPPQPAAAAALHSILGKRGAWDCGRLDDCQSPAKALPTYNYDRRQKFIRPIMLRRDQADVNTNATLKPPKLESMSSACEESSDNLVGRLRFPCKLLIKSAAATPRLQCLFHEVDLSK